MANKNKLVKVLKSAYDSWVEYTKAFDELQKSVEEDRKNLIKDKAEPEEIQDFITKVSVQTGLHLSDINILADKVVRYYEIVKAGEYDKDLDADMVYRINKLLMNIQSPNFVIHNGKFEEKKKGFLESKIEEVKSSPIYQGYLDKV